MPPFIEIKIKLCLLVLCSVYLSGCSFPIVGISNLSMGGSNLINGSSLRITFSIVVYAILLSILATIPLFIIKSFESSTVYKYYKLFWCIASFIFANLFLLLLNIGPDLQYFSYMLILILLVLILTLLPAAYQYHKNRLE